MPRSRVELGIALVAMIATTRCTQVQDFRSDGGLWDAVAGDGGDTGDGGAGGDVPPPPPPVCRANGFAGGPVELSTGGDNTAPVLARSGADLAVAWHRMTTSAVSLRFVDPVTHAPRGAAIAVYADSASGGRVRDLAAASARGGVVLAFTRYDATGSEVRIAFVGRDGSVVARSVPLGVAATERPRVSAFVADGSGFALTVATARALWLVRLDGDAQPVGGAAAATRVVDRESGDVETSAVGWDPTAQRYVMVYPRAVPGSLMMARVSGAGVLEASDDRVIAKGVQATHGPGLAWSGAGFGVLSCVRGGVAGGCEPVFRALTPDGAPVGSVARLWRGNAEVLGLPGDTSLAFGGGSYAAIWSGAALPGEGRIHNLRFVTIDTAGVPRGDLAPLPIDADNSLSPAIAWDGSGFAAAWIQYDVATSASRVFAGRLCTP